MQPHKHAALIKAWADGAKIECKDSGIGEWVDCYVPAWTEYGEYRIKPEPQYPETRMDDNEMQEFFNQLGMTNHVQARRLFAALVIRRAIQDGDVILPNKD